MIFVFRTSETLHLGVRLKEEGCFFIRQRAEVDRMRHDGSISLPPREKLAQVPGLSNEMIERLTVSAPQTLAEASRVRGVTPAALAALWLHARKSA